MEGYLDIQITGNTLVQVADDASWRGFQIQNPRRCRLNFYADESKNRKLFCMREFVPIFCMQNINISGKIFVEAIGLGVTETASITINLM